MTDTQGSGPDLASIGQSQNVERNLRRQLAARTTYRYGKVLHLIGTIVALVLALASPLVLSKKPDLGPSLGAFAGLWIFVSRLVFEPLRLHQQVKGARLQEMFDTDVLGLPWNDALVESVSEEEVRQASKSLPSAKGLGDWYPAGTNAPWPMSVLVCQRSNAVWARRQHLSYGVFLIVAAAAWGVMGAGFAVIEDASLAQYLTTMVLPSLPAMLDAVELARGHLGVARARRLLEVRTNSLTKTPSSVTLADLREIQDRLFNLRAEAPLLPEWFYKLLKRQFETDMVYAAEQIAGGSDGE